MINERERLDTERRGLTRKVVIGDHEFYIVANTYDNGQLGEVFIQGLGKEGSTMRGVMDFASTLLSINLQMGVPLKDLADKFKGMKFDPCGSTNDPDIPKANSIIDYLFQWLEVRFGLEQIDLPADALGVPVDPAQPVRINVQTLSYGATLDWEGNLRKWGPSNETGEAIE